MFMLLFIFSVYEGMGINPLDTLKVHENSSFWEKLSFGIGYEGGICYTGEDLLSNSSGQWIRNPFYRMNSLLYFDESTNFSSNTKGDTKFKKNNFSIGIGLGIIRNTSLSAWDSPEAWISSGPLKNLYHLYTFEITYSREITSCIFVKFRVGILKNKITSREGNIDERVRSNWDILGVPIDFIIQRKWKKMKVGFGYEYIFSKAVEEENIGAYTNELPDWIEVTTKGRGHGACLSFTYSLDNKKTGFFIDEIDLVFRFSNTEEYENNAPNEYNWNPVKMSFSGVYIKYNLGTSLF